MLAIMTNEQHYWDNITNFGQYSSWSHHVIHHIRAGFDLLKTTKPLTTAKALLGKRLSHIGPLAIEVIEQLLKNRLDLLTQINEIILFIYKMSMSRPYVSDTGPSLCS